MHFSQTQNRSPLTESQKFLQITNSKSTSNAPEPSTSSQFQQQKPRVLPRNQVSLKSIFPFQEQPQISESRLDQNSVGAS